jgi:hypothetical protein
VRALRTAKALDPTSAALHPLIVQFRLLASSSSFASQPEVIRSTVEAALPELMDGLSLEAFVVEILQRNPRSGAHVLAAAKAKLSVNPESKDEVEELVFQLLREETVAKLEVSSLHRAHVFALLC